METIGKIKKYITSEMKDIKGYIKERALMYTADFNESALFDLAMDKEPVCNYDQEDCANHNFDMGALYQLQNILKIIEDGK